MSEQELARIGRDVTGRLNANDQILRVEGKGFDLFLRQGFLEQRDCQQLIAMIDINRRPSGLLAETPDPSFRTSESCDMNRAAPLVERIDGRICALLGMHVRQGETLQGQRYAVGQVFKAHYDYFHSNMPYWQDEQTRGGQRCWTAMIYLDQPASGGETAFPAAGFRITPQAGMLLAWNNMMTDGTPNPQALHESLPVTAGVKTIVTKWYREGYWC